MVPSCNQAYQWKLQIIDSTIINTSQVWLPEGIRWFCTNDGGHYPNHIPIIMGNIKKSSIGLLLGHPNLPQSDMGWMGWMSKPWYPWYPFCSPNSWRGDAHPTHLSAGTPEHWPPNLVLRCSYRKLRVTNCKTNPWCIYILYIYIFSIMMVYE